MKGVVVCCYGAWNREDDSGPATNVVRPSRASLWLGENGAQAVVQAICCHFGTDAGAELDLPTGGGVGAGVPRDVQECHALIADGSVWAARFAAFVFRAAPAPPAGITGLIVRSSLPRRDRTAGLASERNVVQSLKPRRRAFGFPIRLPVR